MEALSSLYKSPLSDLGKYLFENRIARIVCVVLFIIFALASLGIAFYAAFIVQDAEQRTYFFTYVLPIFLVPAGFIALLFLLYVSTKTLDKFEVQLEKIHVERKKITQKIEDHKKPDIFNTIQLSLNQLDEYYTINKGQARSSFRFSLFAIVIGLITISVGIWFFYLGKTQIELTFITGIAGVLLEFIGGAYFFMYKKSLEQVNLFFGQLIKTQDTMLAINLARDISDESKRLELTDRIITSLLERNLAIANAG